MKVVLVSDCFFYIHLTYVRVRKVKHYPALIGARSMPQFDAVQLLLQQYY